MFNVKFFNEFVVERINMERRTILLSLLIWLCNSFVQASSLLRIDDAYLNQHDIIYLVPEYDGFNGFPLGNGDFGGMLWFSDKGIELQLSKSICMIDRRKAEPLCVLPEG